MVRRYTMDMNNKLHVAVALIGVIILAAGANIFAGVYVSPIQFESFQKEHAAFEVTQSARIEEVSTVHAADMLELQKTLGRMSTELGKMQATNEAMLRELGNIRREIRRR